MFNKKEKIRLGTSTYYYKEKNRLTLVCYANMEMLNNLLKIAVSAGCKVTFWPRSLTEKTTEIVYEGAFGFKQVEREITDIFKGDSQRRII